MFSMTLILIKKKLCVCAFLKNSFSFYLRDLYISIQSCGLKTQRERKRKYKRQKQTQKCIKATMHFQDYCTLQRCSLHSDRCVCVCFCKINDDTKIKTNGSPKCVVCEGTLSEYIPFCKIKQKHQKKKKCSSL